MTTICWATKYSLDHVHSRHGPSGSADARFDDNFLDAWGGYAPIMKAVYEQGDSADEYDNSGRVITKIYLNFRRRTGGGYDREGYGVDFKGVEMVGVHHGTTFEVETMYPKGIWR